MKEKPPSADSTKLRPTSVEQAIATGDKPLQRKLGAAGGRESARRLKAKWAEAESMALARGDHLLPDGVLSPRDERWLKSHRENHGGDRPHEGDKPVD
jgi:hypothetical protein